MQHPSRRPGWRPKICELQNQTGWCSIILLAGQEVYVDDSFQPGAAEGRPSEVGLTTGTTGGAWNQLSSFEATRKENEQRAAKFRGPVLIAYWFSLWWEPIAVPNDVNQLQTIRSVVRSRIPFSMSLFVFRVSSLNPTL